MKNEPSMDGTTRRGFVGGVGSLLAAASYTADVPESAVAQVTDGDDSNRQAVSSPNGDISVTVDVSDGTPSYELAVDGTTYVGPSGVGFDFQNQDSFGATDAQSPDVTVTGSSHSNETEEWNPVWGQFDNVSEDYNTLTVGLNETGSPSRSGNLEVRVFDDGIGFRFVFDDDFAANSGNLVITSENTAFDFAANYTSWWIQNRFAQPPGEAGRFEDEYVETPLSEVPDGTRSQSPSETAVRNGVHTPLTVDTGDGGPYLSVHEADLDDYATLSLAPDGDTSFSAELAPLPDGTRVSVSTPHVTPWRTIQVGSTPGELIESSLIPLLNEDLDTSALPTDNGDPDTEWLTPRMYIGIWWTMIAGNANWEYLNDSEAENPAETIHGARTERMKRYMTFASEHRLDSVLVEGWNEGWSSYGGDASGNALEMGVADSYPDFDVPEVTDFGASLSNAVEMTMHDETSGNLFNYEDEILNKNIFAEYEDEGIRTIKNGYVNNAGLYNDKNSPNTATINHHCQIAVDHHRTVIENAAQHRQMLEIHEGIKPTGERRTYPNVAAREVVKAQEYDGFGALGSPVGRDHHVTLPFTRMLAGPTSYQPGIFDITFNDETGDQIQTTRAKQLAMYPAYNAGIQMAADRIEAYVNDSLDVGEFVQAASGTLDGMITADTYRNAFGTNFVPIDPNREPSGARVSFTVTDVTAGTYDLHLRYASDGSDNDANVLDYGSGRATVVVNGTERTIEPSFTGGWDQWAVFTTSVELSDGDNTVAVELRYNETGEFTGDVGGFNLNTVGVTEQGAGAPFPAAYTEFTNAHAANENFDAEREFAFIEDVPAGDWDETRVVDSAIGEYLVIARQKGQEWYISAMNDDNGRSFQVPLDFLESQSNNWTMEMYTDAYGTTVDVDPTGVRTTESIVTAGDMLTLSAARGGGTAVRLAPATANEASGLSVYEQPAQNLSFEIDDQTLVNERFARGLNESDFISGQTTVEIVVDGTVRSKETIRFPPNNERGPIEFDERFSEAGEYGVTLREPGGDELASTTVTVSEPAPGTGTELATFDAGTSDDEGPGGYTYPTGDDFPSGAFDAETIELYETDDRYAVTFRLNGPLTNPFGGPNGFSLQKLQVYLRDPTGSGGTTEAAPGINATLESPYQYLVDVHGWRAKVYDATNGLTYNNSADQPEYNEVLSDDVFVKAFDDQDAIRFSIPKSVIPNLSNLQVVPLVTGHDGSTSGINGVRQIQATAAEFRFGGRDGSNAPRVIDLATPEGQSQSEVLSYTAGRATLPYLTVGAASNLVETYDSDDDGEIDVEELDAGITDFNNGSLSKEQLNDLADAYFRGL